MSSGFVSETEIAEKRRLRQEEWEKVRLPDQPVEAPEEVYDPRSLFDKLEEQKNRKQQEYEEAHKLKNMIKGLDDDEVEFLDFVDRKKLEAEQKKDLEERQELLAFRKKVEELKESSFDQRIQTEIRHASKGNLNSGGAKSQVQLLKGVVLKRKSNQSEQSSEPAEALKGDKIEDQETEVNSVNGKDGIDCKKRKRCTDDAVDNAQTARGEGEQGLTCVGILPSLCHYPESSDESDHSDSSASDCDGPTSVDLVGRKLYDKNYLG